MPLVLFVFAALLLLTTLPDYGVSWDEAYPNLPAARRHADWMGSLFSHPEPFSAATIAEHWQSTSHHPTLVRSLAALGMLTLSGVCSEPTAARVPISLLFAAFLAGTYAWLKRRHGSPWPALWGSLALLAFPRLFAHAHLAAIDLPMAMIWVVALWTFLWASGRGWRRAAVLGLVYGLALSTKLHALFLPLVMLAHNARYRRLDWRAYAMMALLAPLVYVAVQPLLWHHPLEVVLERLGGLSQKVESAPIRLYYLGRTYLGDTPWHYPLVMSLVVFPIPVLLLLAVGAGGRTRKTHRSDENEGKPPPAGPAREWVFTFAASAAVSYGIVLLPKAQAYDGVRLILPGVLSLALLSSLGMARLLEWGASARPRARLPALFLPLLLLPGACSTWRLHPWQLSHYNLLGRLVGQERFETSYWCEGLNREAARDLDRRLTPGAKLHVVAGPWEQLAYYQQLGWLRADARLAEPPPYDFHLMQVRQGMFSESLGWPLYRHGKRIAEYGPRGRPVYILFGPLEDALGFTEAGPAR